MPNNIATNRRAKRDFHLFDKYECGIVLQGSEVKSLRESRTEIAEAYGRVIDNELWLISMHIPAYGPAGEAGAHETNRNKKLLLHHKEIQRIKMKLEQEPLTIIPLSVYFKRGKAKVEISLAKRKLKTDKRADKDKTESKKRAARAVRRDIRK